MKIRLTPLVLLFATVISVCGDLDAWNNGTNATIRVGQATAVSLTLTNTASGTNAVLVADAANTLALRNGANTEELRVYSTYTDPSNYARLVLKFPFSNTAQLKAEGAGTGASSITAMTFDTANSSLNYNFSETSSWIISGSGNILQMGTDSSTPATQTLKAPDGSGTDRAGGNLTLEGGQSTGTGVAGNVIIKTANTVTTGSTANTYSERAHYIPKWIDLTESTATELLRFSVPATNYVGLSATVTVYATDGTDFQSLTTLVTQDAVAKTTTITTVGTPTAAQTALAGSAGTLSVTFTFIDNGSNVASLKCNAVSSLTQTTLRAKVVITAINSNGPATVTEL